jgi:ATP-dependent DNA ligase
VFIPPMLATRLEDPRRLADPRFIAEPKLDGQRAQFHVRDYRTVHAFSRPGRELIRLPGLAWLREIRWPVASAVLDGEAVAGDGSEGIQAVFEARTRPGSPMAFAAFDVLELDGHSVMGALDGPTETARGSARDAPARHLPRPGDRGCAGPLVRIPAIVIAQSDRS